jgi:hypothetical protein
MAYIHEKECEAAGLDPKEVLRIARGISKYAKQAQALGIQVFGGSGTGSLRFPDGWNGDLVLADLDGTFDGGDGKANDFGDDGLMRGEVG